MRKILSLAAALLLLVSTTVAANAAVIETYSLEATPGSGFAYGSTGYSKAQFSDNFLDNWVFYGTNKFGSAAVIQDTDPSVTLSYGNRWGYSDTTAATEREAARLGPQRGIGGLMTKTAVHLEANTEYKLSYYAGWGASPLAAEQKLVIAMHDASGNVLETLRTIIIPTADHALNYYQILFNLNAATDVRFSFSVDNSDWILFNNVQLSSTAATPIPAAAWLAGTGLFGLIGLRRRQKRQA